MNGMDEKSGKFISGMPYLKQSVRRIIRRPKKSLVMHPKFGTTLPEFVGENITDQELVDLTSDITDSLEEGIPELKPEFKFGKIVEGYIPITVTGSFKESPINLENV